MSAVSQFKALRTRRSHCFLDAADQPDVRRPGGPEREHHPDLHEEPVHGPSRGAGAVAPGRTPRHQCHPAEQADFERCHDRMSACGRRAGRPARPGRASGRSRNTGTAGRVRPRAGSPDVLRPQRRAGDRRTQPEDGELGSDVPRVQPAPQWLTPTAIVAPPGLVRRRLPAPLTLVGRTCGPAEAPIGPDGDRPELQSCHRPDRLVTVVLSRWSWPEMANKITAALATARPSAIRNSITARRQASRSRRHGRPLAVVGVLA